MTRLGYFEILGRGGATSIMKRGVSNQGNFQRNSKTLIVKLVFSNL